MKNIKFLSSSHYFIVQELITREYEDFSPIYQLGWTEKEIKNHLNKNTNYSIGFFSRNCLNAILISQAIKNIENYELEVMLIYVEKKLRRKKIASKLFNFLETDKNLSKIYLEVSEKNKEAIKFYEKNNFVFLNFRHNYYNYNNETFNARCYQKIYK